MHNEFGIPSDETEEIIRLRIELAKGKAKQQKLETVL